MTHFQVYLKQSGPDPRNQKPGPSPKASLWYRQATSKLHSLSLSSDHSPEWLFHTFSSYFQDLLPSLSFSWWFCFPFSLRTSPRLPKRMSTNSHPQSHRPNYLCLNRALIPLSRDLLFQGQPLHSDLRSRSPFAFSRTLLQLFFLLHQQFFPFYWIIPISVQTYCNGSHLKKACHPSSSPRDPQISRVDFTHCHQFSLNLSLSFFFNRRAHPLLFIYFSISLNPWRVQHHMDSVSNGLSWKVALEFGTIHATGAMSTRYLSPGYSGFVRFSSRRHCVILCFVHISTSLA